MATLKMASPWRDPRDGTYYLKRRIPERYRPVCGRRGDQLKLSIGTKDAAVARAAWPAVLAQWDALVAGWERKLNAVALTPATAAEVAAKWASWIAGDMSRLDRGGEDASIFESERSLSSAIAEKLGGPTAAERAVKATERLTAHMAEAISVAGICVTPETQAHLMDALRPVVAAAYHQAALSDMGIVDGKGARWNPLAVTRARLPDVPDDVPAPPEPAAPAAPVITLTALFERWKTVATAKARTVAETDYVVKMVVKFIGKDDASAVTKDALRSWRTEGKATGLTNNTWNNRLSMLRQVLDFGVKEDLLPVNPTDGLRLEKSKAAARFPFTDDEAALILNAARRETKPSLRWAHWVMAFTGMRAGEVLQLTAGDVRTVDGVHCLHINEDHPTKTIKTGERRNVPLHPALIAEGFLDYVKTIEGDSPVFPDKGLDKFGKRGGRAWNVTGKWVRDVVGIADETKAPDHAWRHRLEDCLRAAEVPEDARDAVTGRARKTTGRFYGVRGESLKRLHRELSKLPVPPGVTIKGWRQEGAAAAE